MSSPTNESASADCRSGDDSRPNTGPGQSSIDVRTGDARRFVAEKNPITSMNDRSDQRQPNLPIRITVLVKHIHGGLLDGSGSASGDYQFAETSAVEHKANAIFRAERSDRARRKSFAPRFFALRDGSPSIVRAPYSLPRIASTPRSRPSAHARSSCARDALSGRW